MLKKRQKGGIFESKFRLIEVLILIAVLVVFLAVAITPWALKASKKSAIESYKRSVESVRQGVQLCLLGGKDLNSGPPGTSICGGAEEYPKLHRKCGQSPYFQLVVFDEDSWAFTTRTSAGGDYWDCGGCRLVCTSEDCSEVDEGTCFK